jgi:hypothetical protein
MPKIEGAGGRLGPTGAVSEVVADPKNSPTPAGAQAGLIRIIARRVPWPPLKERADRAGLRLRWDAVREETAEPLAAGTEFPLEDAARILTMRGLSGETRVTLRHEGSPHDSFKPMPLRIPAAAGAKRAENAARIAAMRTRGCEETAAEGAADPEVAAEAQAAPLAIPDERQRIGEVPR